MKTSYWTFVSLICFIGFISSCTKRRDEPRATFKFRMNGKEVQWYGSGLGEGCIMCRPGIGNHGTYFVLHSSSPQSYGESLGLKINSTALNLATYSDTITAPVDSLHAATRLYIGSSKAGATEVGDFATVTVTSIREGKYYDGTFKARLTSSPYGPGAPKIMIEQGEFRNVRGGN